jgi:hypothetical protein
MRADGANANAKDGMRKLGLGRFTASLGAVASGSLAMALVLAALKPGASVVVPEAAAGFEGLQQEAAERTVNSLTWERRHALPPLSQPYLLRSDKRGRVYIFDRPADRLRLNVFSPDGTLIRTIDPEVTGAPAFRNPTDLFVDRDDRLVITDPQLGRLLVLETDGTPVRMVRMEETYDRLVDCQDGTAVAMPTSPSAKAVFQRVDLRTGGVVGRFGQILANRKGGPLALDGFLVEGEVGEFIYAGRYAGLIGRFSCAGERLMYRKTIDPVPLPDLDVTEGGGWMVGAKARVAALGAVRVGDKVAVLAALPSLFGKRVFDLYDLTTGNYLRSVDAPKGIRRVAGGLGTLATLDTESVSIFAAPWTQPSAARR